MILKALANRLKRHAITIFVHLRVGEDSSSEKRLLEANSLEKGLGPTGMREFALILETW